MNVELAAIASVPSFSIPSFKVSVQQPHLVILLKIDNDKFMNSNLVVIAS